MVDHLAVDDVAEGKIDDVMFAKWYGRLGTIVGEGAKTLPPASGEDHC